MLVRTLILTTLLAGAAPAADPLIGLLEDLVASGDLVGAQALVGERDRIVVEAFVGAVAPESERLVDAETQFCIGSTSKPLASAVVLNLAAEGKLNLDEPISRRLPAFTSGPTLRQLLSHHGGVYSQRDGLSDTQKRWIRDFRLTLREAVDGIAGEKPSAQPGERFAYSGAGYCVVGRVAGIAGGRSFPALLQERLTKPLGMARTTYFPKTGDPNVATGRSRETPHLLGDELRLALIGGSVYSTTRDLSRFARMMLGKGSLGPVEILPKKLWAEMIANPGFSDEPYALGWGLKPSSTRIRHGGALAASRAALEIDLETGRYAIVLYSLAKPSAEVQRRINQAVSRCL